MSTEKLFNELREKHPDEHVISIFGYPEWVNPHDFDDVAKNIFIVARNAKFFKWSGGVVGACKTFCELFFIDPALVEAYIGMRFEQLI